ncbi:MAG: redoxin domain-containing protein [Eubacterium sp.]|nr:redoxin domain-containing protein [Eubacterium sp.]
MKLAKGMKIPEFTYQAPDGSEHALYDLIRSGQRTAIVFLRFYGCPFTQLDLRSYEEHYKEMTATSGQLLVVVQSGRELVREKLKKHPVSFPVACDPEGALYKLLDIFPAVSKEVMRGPHADKKRAAATAAGIEHGVTDGIVEQLPAAFVVYRSGTVLQASYASFIDESVTAEQLAEWLH